MGYKGTRWSKTQYYRRKRRADELGCSIEDVPSKRIGRPPETMRGANNPRWNSGRILSSHGYVLVRVGSEHPLCAGNQYAYEHHLVWVSANGPISSGYCVHHRNEDKTDNRIENLELLTAAEHQRYHANETRDRDVLGRFN